VPPLVLTDEQADAFVAALPGVLDAAVTASAASSVPATAPTREDP
jgi:hypothetical protein